MYSNQKQSLQTALRWASAATDKLPATTPVTLFYDGLLGLCYNRDCHAEIGVLSKAPNHQPRLCVIAVTNGEAMTLLDIKWMCTVPFFNTARLCVKNPIGDRPLGFYIPAGRKEDDSKNFLWQVDIEELHNRKFGIMHNGFWPRFIFEQGIFYTLSLTEETYQAHPVGGGRLIDLGNIAHMTAANIDCDCNDGALRLTFDDRHPSLEWCVQGRRLFIIIQNHCEPSGSPRRQGRKKFDTDFILYYEALQLGQANIRYTITTDREPSYPDLSCLDQDLITALMHAGILSVDKDRTIVSTNEAPCGRAGFGFSEELI